MADRERILDKIKKCLALSASQNEHEAAAALRQARALMDAHGITDTEMKAIGVSEESTLAGAVDSPAHWESTLAASIAHMFGCHLLHARKDWYTAMWSFIGVSPQPEVARYAFEVLFRQAKKARQEHIKSNLKRFKKTNKTRRADLFSEGWVHAATAAISPWVSSQAQTDAVDAYMQIKHPKTGNLETRNRNAGRQLSDRDRDSYYAGRRSGEQAELNKGVGADSAPLALTA